MLHVDFTSSPVVGVDNKHISNLLKKFEQTIYTTKQPCPDFLLHFRKQQADSVVMLANTQSDISSDLCLQSVLINTKMKTTGPSALVEGLHKQAHPDPSHIKSFIHTTTRHDTSNQHLI